MDAPDDPQGLASLGSLRSKLQYATDLIRDQRLREARTALIKIVKEYPSSERGWFLLCQVVPETDVKVHCLEQVLSINPANRSAWEQLNGILNGEVEVNLTRC